MRCSFRCDRLAESPLDQNLDQKLWRMQERSANIAPKQRAKPTYCTPYVASRNKSVPTWFLGEELE